MPKAIPENWESVPLGNVVLKRKGKKPKTTIEQPKEGFYPYILIHEMEGGGIRKYTNDKSVPIVEEDEVLLVWDGSIGKCTSGIKGAIGSTLVGIKPLAQIPTKFIEYFIRSKHNYIHENSTGTGLQHINKNFFNDCIINLPPVAEQERIVAKLDILFERLNKINASLAKIPELLQNFRQQVLTQAVTGKLTEEWRSLNGIKIENSKEEWLKLFDQFNEKEKRKRGVQFSSNLFCNDWIALKPIQISDVSDYSLGIGPFGSNLKVADYTDYGAPLVFVRHIKANNFKDKDPKFISQEKFIELKAHSTKSGDLLITKMGDPPGDCEIYPDDLRDAVITSDCLKFRIHPNFNNIFYKHVINSELVKSQLIGITKGVAQQKISLKRFKTLDLPLPTIKEQHEINSRIEGLFEKADKIQTHYELLKAKIEQLPQAILHKAFKGKLVPQLESDGDARDLLREIENLKAKIN